MKKAIVFLANGFEEMEALGTVDILRRGGIEVTTVSITDNPVVTGAHNVPVTADTTLGKADLAGADALETAFRRGTIFPDLDLPFMMGGAC